MQFGNWELRSDSSYWLAANSEIWPSSNAVDSGKLTTEENLRNIRRDIVNKNYVINPTHFGLSINATRTGVFVSPGEGVIQGYHFAANNSIEVKVPDNTINSDSGVVTTTGPVMEYTLGISLSYDAANHVTGDVVNKEGNIGESEVLSGVYLKWFDECQLECYYDNILVLGRAWVQNGKIIADGTILPNGRMIYHALEIDPFKNHRTTGDVLELQVHGHATTQYDTLRENITQIHSSIYSYDSMHFPIELNRYYRTKPPSMVTNLQDYVDLLPDWYTSKYGDYMTGALRFNHLSKDAIYELTNRTDINKDDVPNDYQDGVIISPRTYGDLTRNNESTLINDNGEFIKEAVDYSNGGTIMTIVPGTYTNTTDENYGYTGIHAALISQKYGETGLRIHTNLAHNNKDYGTTRITHYNGDDSNHLYKKDDDYAADVDHQITDKFIIENIDNDGKKTSINMKHGEIFIDSYGKKNNKIHGSGDNAYTCSGIQLFAANEEDYNNQDIDVEILPTIDLRIDNKSISVAKHLYNNHRNSTRGSNFDGKIEDNKYFELSSSQFQFGNLLVESSKPTEVKGDVKETIFSVKNDNGNGNIRPYITFRPRIYSEQVLLEDSIQVGTRKSNDRLNNESLDYTSNKVVIKKIGFDSNSISDNESTVTYIEQDALINNTKTNTNCHVFNKLIPSTKISNPAWNEIHGIYSYGNIGCSNKKLSPINKDSDSNNAYTNEAEWVRFTRFRYDLDKDKINSGVYEGSHNSNDGQKWGETYNLEFNTNVANKRANQIIWRYNGSEGVQDGTTLENTPPVVLSYIHDNPNVIDASGIVHATKYTENDNDSFETYIDHAGNTHYNPTNKIRDFLLLENAGLSISGDINNPSWAGDSLNANNHLGVCICQGRVYNAVYNDFAETYEKDNIDEIAQPGEIIVLNPETGKYTVSENEESNLVVGVQSNTYAFLAGGNRINNTQDIIELENEYFTVGIAGKVWVRVIDEEDIKAGDLLVSSNEKGKACKSKNNITGTIIGKSLTTPKYFEEFNCKMVLMQIMLG